MRIEIWSDIACPFCYIGKRKFESALETFPEKDNVEIIWKSFQLMPEHKTLPSKNLHQMLSEKMGWTLEHAKAANNQVVQMAKQAGLDYNFDQSIAPNTLNAHRFVHFATEHGKQNEAEEVLFRSLFTDGKNIDDLHTLMALAKEIGLDDVALKAALENNNYANEVQADIEEGNELGVNGVPFFVFNRKQAISGAQESSIFLETLQKSFADWRKDHPKIHLDVISGAVCTPDGKCE